jgi:DNA-binding NarL/FixJ family response regulator
LAALVAGQEGVVLAGTVDDPRALARLLDTGSINVVLGEAALLDSDFADYSRAYFILLLAAEDMQRALDAGASAILPRDAEADELGLAFAAAGRSLALLPIHVLDLLREEATAPEAAAPAKLALTPRELDVLAALADGASNKMIARRLGISFHTAKFHVAAILAKLDADSRTEAVAQAARLGLVML